MKLLDLRNINFENSLDCNLVATAETYERLVNDLKRECRGAIYDLESTIQKCDGILEGETNLVNGSGVLQSRGLRIDMLCAQVSMAQNAFEDAQRLV